MQLATGAALLPLSRDDEPEPKQTKGGDRELGALGAF